jgi:HPt (histidine-containing phosphotransfer) domain-containing protein
MSNQTSTPFIFHPSIDVGTIREMYGDDYPYIELIFKTVVDHLDEDISSIKESYRLNQLESLRKAIHKIKPVFGFIGMPQLHQECISFEQECKEAMSVSQVEIDYNKLVKSLEEITIIVKEQHEKLTSYNSNP